MFRRYLGAAYRPRVDLGADRRDDHDIPPVVIDFDETGVFTLPYAGELTLSRSTAIENWDDEGGVPTLSEDWYAACGLARRVAAQLPEIGAPIPAACGDGSVHLTWYKNGRRLTVERRAGRIFYGFSGPGGVFEDGPCASDFDALAILRSHLA